MWQAGQTIADLYEVRGINTEGGMAIVHFVWHKAWQMELVIKSPRPELLADPTARERFVAEAETWVKLGLHPNIVTAYYVREIEGFPRIVIEKMDGGSLKQWLRGGRVSDLATALDIAIQIAAGLAYAQKLRPAFVHRDLKPANVLLTPEGEAKVTDFGLVGAVGARVGTPAYMAPEMWTDPEHVTPAADLYSFGVMLYELLAGRRPFDSDEAGTSLGQIKGGRGVLGSMGALRDVGVGSRLSAEDAGASRQVSLGKMGDIQQVGDGSAGELTTLGPLAALTADKLDFYRKVHTTQAPEPPSRFATALPSTLDEICLALLAKKPHQRPASANAVVALLTDAYEAHVGHTYGREAPRETDLMADALNNRALSFLDLKREDDAMACWREALEKNPTHLESSVNFGYWQWITAAIDDAQYVKRLTELEALHGARPEYWRTVAAVHLERGDHERAQPALQRGWPSDAQPTVSARPCYAEEKAGHAPFSVSAIACSESGAYIAAAGAGDIVKLFDGESLQPVRELVRAGAYELAAVMFLGDDLVVTGTGHCGLRLCRASTGECIGPLNSSPSLVGDVHCDTASCLAVSSNRFLIAASYQVLRLPVGAVQPILIWDLPTVTNIQVLEGACPSVLSICFTPDCRQLLSGADDWEGDPMKLWDLESGKCVAVLRGHTGPVYSVAISSDGFLALSGSHDGLVKLWHLATGQCLSTYEGHKAAVRSVAFAKDERFLISGSKDGTIKVWHRNSGRCLRTLEGHSDSVYAIARHPDGEHIFSGSHDRTIRRWTFRPALSWHFGYLLSRPRATREILKHQTAIERLLAAADADVRAGAYHKGYERLREAQQVPGHEKDPAILDRIQECGRYGRRVGLRSAYLAGELTAPAKVPSVSDDLGVAYGPWADSVRQQLDATRPAITWLRFAPGGGLLASGAKDGRIRVWDLASRQCTTQFGDHMWGVSALAWLDDGQHLISAAKTAKWESERTDDTLRLWHWPTAQCLGTFGHHKGGISCAVLTPDANSVATGDWGSKGVTEENLARLWNLRSSECVRTWRGHGDVITAIDVSADGKLLLTASRDRTLRLWDMDSDRCLGILPGHDGTVFAARFSPDGRWVVSAGSDNLVKLWDLASKQCRELAGHESTVCALAFTRDGRYVLSCGEDRRLLLWETASGEQVKSLEGHTDGIVTLDVSQDGRYAASGGYDEIIRLWEFDWNWVFPGEEGDERCQSTCVEVAQD